jgi:hypothetical protein
MPRARPPSSFLSSRSDKSAGVGSPWSWTSLQEVDLGLLKGYPPRWVKSSLTFELVCSALSLFRTQFGNSRRLGKDKVDVEVMLGLGECGRHIRPAFLGLPLGVKLKCASACIILDADLSFQINQREVYYATITTSIDLNLTSLCSTVSWLETH